MRIIGRHNMAPLRTAVKAFATQDRLPATSQLPIHVTKAALAKQWLARTLAEPPAMLVAEAALAGCGVDDLCRLILERHAKRARDIQTAETAYQAITRKAEACDTPDALAAELRAAGWADERIALVMTARG
jgi:hypothetical protein